MAEQALKKLLICSICLDTYTDPKLLQCNHVFCRRCLVWLVDRDQQGQLSIACPLCRQATPIPASSAGVAGLQPAFLINYLLQILNACEREMLYCHVHQERELELYCEKCEELICLECTIKEHHGHEYNLVNKMFEKHKQEIMAALFPAQEQLAVVSAALRHLDTHYGEIFDKQTTLEAQINRSMWQLHEVIEIRKAELIGELHSITQEKLRDLALQREQIEAIQAQLSSYLDMVKKELETNNQAKVLKMRKTITKQAIELTTSFQTDMLKPNTQADVEFSTTAREVCQNYGQVVAVGSSNPLACHATGDGLEVATVGKKSTAILQAVNFKGQPCEEPMKSLECKLVSDITGARARLSIERRGQSQYEISYQPITKGRHHLHIVVKGQHIQGSPFSVTVKSPIEALGAPILTIGGMLRPCNIAINKRGELVVTEWDGHSVSMFSPSGEKLRSFGTYGSGQGQLKSPHGVAVDGEGNVLVADAYNHRIQKFTAEGIFVAAVGTLGSKLHQFYKPVGIAYNASNSKVYVVDWNMRVQILNSDLTIISNFGKEGTGKGQFCRPRDIACDSTGNVYVADSFNHRIQVFTAKGKFLRMFGRCGDRGELNYPVGIAIDSSDFVYVSEYDNHCVSVFTSNGQFVTSFGREREGPAAGEFMGPAGIAVDNTGLVFVCDINNNSAQVF